MDWLTFKFCVLIWVLCVSKTQSQLLNSTSIFSNQLRSACQGGQPMIPPDQCNSCICFDGQIYCTNIPCPEQDCVNGVDLPPPDACNKCICRRGKVTCSKTICIPAPHCPEKQLYPAQNKCNACMCLKGFITCTNNPCAEEPLPSTIPTTTTKKPKKKKKCIEGEPLPGPNECMECFCQNGRKRCKHICNPTLENRFGEEPECVPGQHIPRPDDCNNCICFEGKIHCTHLPCRMDKRIGPECRDDQPVFRPDECNECYCFEGQLECSDLVCIRGSKCVQGQVIPKPDSCNACKCVEGHILCTNYQCPIPSSRNVLSLPVRPGMSSTKVRALHECQKGDIIPPPPPPNDCNTCYCMDNHILCTVNTCEGSDPEIKGRPNEQTDLEILDKKISVEPFIHMLSKNHEKLPAKLIHTHAYNGFHQEITVHANHLPKDATKLLKVLTTSLDNATLASISQTLLASSNSLLNNHDSKIPLDHQVVQTNSLGEGNVLATQSSKLITSGSQSNETILVLPNTKPFDGQNSQSVLPLTSKHQTTWKSVSSPGSQVFNNNQEINPHSSQEEKLNSYYNDDPPSMFTPIDQNNMIRNLSKFSPPNMLPTKPARYTINIQNKNAQFIYPASNPKSININDDKMSYVPFSQEIKQFKPMSSGFVSKHNELPHLRPYQINLPGHNQVFNYYNSSTPIFRPGKNIGTPNNNDGQEKQFIPNFSKYYQVEPQQIPFKPNQNPTLNNKGIQDPPLFLNNPNQPIVAAKQPQLGLKPGQESINPVIIGNQTDQQYIAFPPNFQINPPLIYLPNQKKRIPSIANEGSKKTPPHSMVPSSTAHHTNILNPPQIGVDPEHTQHKPSHSQFVPNPSIYYKNEYEAPKIIEVNPDQEQLTPHSKFPYKYTEHYNPPHTSFEFGDDKHMPKVRNKTRKYNATHSHYEKHTTITYVSEYDPSHPANTLQIVRDPNQHQNAHQFDTYPHSPSDDKNTNQIKSYQNPNKPTISMYPNIFANYPHSSSQPQFIFSKDYSKNKGGLNDPKSAEGSQPLSNSAEDPIHPKSNEHLPPPSQTGPTQNQHPPGVFDDRGSTNGFHYAHNAYEDPRQLKPIHKLLTSKLETPQNHRLPGFFDERGSADPFQYPSNSAKDLTNPKVKLNKCPHFHPYTSIVNPEQPKDNLHISPHSQFGPALNQHKPGLFDNRGVKDVFQYAHNADKNPTHLKPLHKVLLITHSHTPFGPTLTQYSPGIFDERGSADGFQYPSNSAENPIHPKQNNQIQPNSPIDPNKNQHIPGMFDERGSADGFQYPSNSVENPTHPKDNLHKLPLSQFLPSPNQHPLGVFDDRGSAGGFHYPSNSAEDSIHLKGKPPHSPLGPTQNQHLTGMFDERGSADGFQYPSNSAEDPINTKNDPNTIPEPKFIQTQNQPKPTSSDDGYNNNNPLRPWMHLDHDQYKPLSFDNLLNGVHNIPWSFPSDLNKDSDTVTSAPKPRLTTDYDQYKPSSLDNLFKVIHQIPWSVPNQDNNALGSDAEITTPLPGFKPKQDQYGLSMVIDPSISNENKNIDLTDVDDNQLQIEPDVSPPSMDSTDSVSTQYNVLPKLKPDSDPDSLLPIDDGKIPDYYDKLYPLIKAVKKLSDSPIEDSVLGVDNMDQLDLLPFLFPGIVKILNYEPSQDQDDISPVENNDVQRNPLSRLKSKLKQLPENINGIFNWLKSKLNKLVPTKDNATDTKNDIDMTKIFNLLSKLTPPNLKDTAALQNIPFSGFAPEIIENILNDFKEDTLTTTSTPRTHYTHTYENRLKSVPTIPEESRPQAPPFKYPDVHIILHQPYDEDDVDFPPYTKTDGKINLTVDMDSEQLSASMFPKMFNPQFRHRPKDQKEECGDGTQWISNCYSCSCHFGQGMCVRLSDCELRPLGEPMTCKPYSHFKMGCYTCECNGDGVAQCDATDCNTQTSGMSRGSTESPLPIFHEFFDSKKTKEILQYYNFFKKLPKDCPEQDLQTQYPTCERGTSWVSSCHKCECNESGKHECIKIDDCKLDVDKYGQPGRCKPNSKFYPKMNSMPCVECSCNDEGISYCPSADYEKH